MRGNDLEFRDWPMFDRVMERNYDICRRVLETVLGREIAEVDNVVAERAINPHLGSRGVRLDALAKAGGEMFDVEMQRCARGELGKRMRYYQSALDTAMLTSGNDYDDLVPTYIIFICTYDEFGEGLPVYTFDLDCQESRSVRLGHQFQWIVLNACAWERLPSGGLRNLLHYISTGRVCSDELVVDIAKAVATANEDAVWREENAAMLTFEEDMRIQQKIGLRKATEEGMAKGMAEGLEKGMAEGLEKGEDRMAALMERLLSEGRQDDALKAATDSAYRAALFEEYGL